MRTVKPKVFVELGTHSGNSYLAFCQAAQAAQLTVKCYAVDSWRGDDHSGFYDDTVYANLREYNQSHYGEFSTLLRTTFDDAVGYFSDGSIDLLHIDGLHTYGAVRHDFETWEPKLAPNAIVVLHDINVREHAFGVWRFWEELQARFPWNVEFNHCHGLGVLSMCGDGGAPGREWLKPNSPARNILPRYFASLGARIEEGDRYRAAIWSAAAGRKDLEGHLLGILSERDTEIGRLNDALGARDAEMGRLNDALGARGAEMGRLKDVLSARDAELSSIKTEREAQIVWLNDERRRLNSELNAHAANLADLQRRFDKLTRSFRWHLASERTGSFSPHRRPCFALAFHLRPFPHQRLSAWPASGIGVPIRRDPSRRGDRPPVLKRRGKPHAHLGRRSASVRAKRAGDLP